MMENVAISIIIPVYNGEKYLQECLDSVKSQSFRNWQMVCVNDGSTDRSMEILEDNARTDERICVLVQENQGLSISRNRGMEYAEGEYILFLDCDDRLTEGALERLYGQANGDKLDILYYDGDTFFDDGFDDQGQYAAYKKLYHADTLIAGVIPGIDMFRSLYEAKSYRASACMQIIRKGYLQEKGITFYPGIMYEDNIFTLEAMIQAKRTGYCHHTIYERRMHEDSIVTARKGGSHLRSYVIAYTEIASFVFKSGLPVEVMPGITVQLNSLMDHAVEVARQMTEEERRSFSEEQPEGEIILKMVVGRLTQGSVQERYYALKQIKRRVKKLGSLLKTEGVRNTAAFCIEKIFGERPYRPSWKAGKICRTPFSSEHPFVSVVLPVHNGQEYLGETLESLHQQTLRNVEFIFVDDGSTDNSVDILRKAGEEDERVRIVLQEHSNAGAARNRGMEEAKGKYVIFLDSDDTYDPRLLAYAYDRAERFDAQVVMFDADIIQLSEKKRIEPAWMKQTAKLPKTVFSGADAPEYLFQMLNPWTKLYRRAYIQQEGFRYQSQYAANDAYFTIMALACAQRIVTLPLPLVHYQIGRSGNIQSKKDREPLGAYRAFVAVRMDLRERGVLAIFEKALAIKAMESMARELETLKSEESKRILSDVLCNGGLDALGFGLIQNDVGAQNQLGEKMKLCKDMYERMKA